MKERRSLTTWEQRLFGKSFAVFGLIALVLPCAASTPS
jgi:hypothetical protein